jgi:hypothetical protein
MKKGSMIGVKNKDFINSLIPLGMIFGGGIGVIFEFLIALGAGIGLVLGAIVYAFYSQKQ